jgi:hypothetical protein
MFTKAQQTVFVLAAIAATSRVGGSVLGAQSASLQHVGAGNSATPRLYTPVPATLPRPEFWLPDEPISAMSISDGRLYIGGQFSQVGPFTGPFAVLDATTGAPVLQWPHVNGQVNAIISDHQGGWYVGGEFTRIGGQDRSYLAHVLSDGSVSPFHPLLGGQVNALALDQSTLYLAGAFQDIGGQVRYHAAALDSTSGALLPWAPLAHAFSDSSQRIQRILISGQTAFLAGYYNTSSAIPRRNLAAVDAISGALITDFNPDPNDSVFDLVLSGTTLYAGGNFTQIRSVPRSRLADLDVVTGAPGPLNFNIDGTVFALDMSGTTLYFGGAFTTVAGSSRGCGAALNTSALTLLSWNPRAVVPDNTSILINDIVVATGRVYVAGSFRSIGGQRQLAIGRVDPTSGDALPWTGDAAGPSATQAISLSLQGSVLACGGNFQTVGGERRDGTAAYNAVTGQLLPWHANVYGQNGEIQPGNVLQILAAGPTVWLGGIFSFVNGAPRHTVASVDAATGQTTNPFNASFFFAGDGTSALALRGNTLFVGGAFNTPVSGQHCLISLDTTTAAVVPGSTNANGAVTNLVLSSDGSSLYMAGQMSSVGTPGVPRNHLAAIDPTNGAVLPWDPNPDTFVSGMQFADGRVWVSGNFHSVGGDLHWAVASLDPITGSASAAFWPSLLYSSGFTAINSTALYGETLIAAGGFNTVNGLPQLYMTALNSYDGLLLNWSPPLTHAVNRVCVGDGILAATSVEFEYPGGELRPLLAVYDAH